MGKALPPLTHLADWHDRLPRYAFAANFAPGKRVLDLGCATGEGSRLLAEAGASLVVGVDPSSALIQQARERHGLDNLRFLARYVEDPLDVGYHPGATAPQLLDEAEAEFSTRRTEIRMRALSADETRTTQVWKETEVETDSDDAPDDGEGGDHADVDDEWTADPSRSDDDVDDPEEDGDGSEDDDDSDEIRKRDGSDDVGEGANADVSRAQEERDPEAAEREERESGDSRDDAEREGAGEDEGEKADDEGSEEDLDERPEQEIETGELNQPVEDAAWDEPEQYDLVLAFNAGLPIADVDFLARLASLLAPGGILILSTRLSGRHGLGDLLASFEPNTDSGEPVVFRDESAMASMLDSVFDHRRDVVQYSSLSTVFEPANDHDGDGIEHAPMASAPRFRLCMLGNEELPAAPSDAVSLSLDDVLEKLAGGVESLVLHALNLEHRGLVYEEQLSLKDALIDDLEREVRAIDHSKRELAGMVNALQQELDNLQGELTTPAPPPAPPEPAISADPQLESELLNREQRIQYLAERLEHAQSLITSLQETVAAQRLTIEALSVRADLVPGTAGGDASALQARIAQRERELAELQAQTRELQHQLEKAGGERQELAHALENERAVTRDLQEALNQARTRQSSTQNGDGNGSEAMAQHIEKLQAELERLNSELVNREKTIASLRQENADLDAKLGRFVRGRRQKRAGLVPPDGPPSGS